MSIKQKIKDISAIWVALVSLGAIVTLIFGVINYFDRNYASADSIKEVMQSIQKSNEKYDLEIDNLKYDLFRKQIRDLEKECTSECTLDKKQELEQLREDKDMLKKKMETLESK